MQIPLFIITDGQESIITIIVGFEGAGTFSMLMELCISFLCISWPCLNAFTPVQNSHIACCLTLETVSPHWYSLFHDKVRSANIDKRSINKPASTKMLWVSFNQTRAFISPHKVHFLDYNLWQIQNKMFCKSDKMTCKWKGAPASSYYHLFAAWLTRTLRSNVFCLLLPAEMTACYENRQEGPLPPLWRRAKHCCYCQRLWQMYTVRHHRWCAATGPDSSLCWKDRSVFTNGQITFTNHSQFHFSHFPLSYARAT